MIENSQVCLLLRDEECSVFKLTLTGNFTSSKLYLAKAVLLSWNLILSNRISQSYILLNTNNVCYTLV